MQIQQQALRRKKSADQEKMVYQFVWLNKNKCFQEKKSYVGLLIKISQ